MTYFFCNRIVNVRNLRKDHMVFWKVLDVLVSSWSRLIEGVGICQENPFKSLLLPGIADLQVCFCFLNSFIWVALGKFQQRPI